MIGNSNVWPDGDNLIATFQAIYRDITFQKQAVVAVAHVAPENHDISKVHNVSDINASNYTILV